MRGRANCPAGRRSGWRLPGCWRRWTVRSTAACPIPTRNRPRARPCGGDSVGLTHYIRPATIVGEKKMDAAELRAMQAPIKDRYKSDPKAALITLKAKGSIE